MQVAQVLNLISVELNLLLRVCVRRALLLDQRPQQIEELFLPLLGLSYGRVVLLAREQVRQHRELDRVVGF